MKLCVIQFEVRLKGGERAHAREREAHRTDTDTDTHKTKAAAHKHGDRRCHGRRWKLLEYWFRSAGTRTTNLVPIAVRNVCSV